MRDHDHLLEPILQPAQQLHDICTTLIIERPEHLVQHQQRERLSTALGDQLRHGETQHEVREILLATRDHLPRDAAADEDDLVVLVEFELVVAIVGEVGEKRSRDLAEFRTQPRIQLRAQLAICRVELVVHATLRLELPLLLAHTSGLLGGGHRTRQCARRVAGIAFGTRAHDSRILPSPRRAVEGTLHRRMLLGAEAMQSARGARGVDKGVCDLQCLRCRTKERHSIWQIICHALRGSVLHFECGQRTDRSAKSGVMRRVILRRELDDGTRALVALRREQREFTRLLCLLLDRLLDLQLFPLQRTHGGVHLDTRRVQRTQIVRLHLQLLLALLEVHTFHAQHLELVTKLLHQCGMTGAKRTKAGGAWRVGTELLQCVVLCPDVHILVALLCAPRLDFLLVADPIGTTCAGGLQRHRRHRARIDERRQHVGAQRRGGRELLESRSGGVHAGGQSRDLFRQRLSPRRLTRSLLEQLQFRAQRQQGREFRQDRRQATCHLFRLAHGGLRALHVALRQRDACLGANDRRLQLHIARERTLRGTPTRFGLHEQRVHLAERRHRVHECKFCGAHGELRGLYFRREQVGIRHRLRQRAQRRDHLATRLSCDFLRLLQAVIAKHARQEATTIGRTHRRHGREILLAREVGGEELTTGHAESLFQQSTNGPDAVGDGCRATIHVQFGRRQTAHHTIAVRAELEFQFRADRCTWRGTVELDRLSRAARDRVAVQRPGNAFQNRRLARTVRPDDAGETILELDQRVDMLPEVLQPECAQSHGASGPVSMKPASAPGSCVKAIGSLTRCR